MPYDKHPSERLKQAFKGYQGQDPAFSKFLFFGLDANFAADIDQHTTIFEDVENYLRDGVGYWQRTNRHHPFLNSDYRHKCRCGYTYHSNFSKLELTADYAEQISFVELLEFPTVGSTKILQLKQWINPTHIARLNEQITSSNDTKKVYIARGVYPYLYEIGQSHGCFMKLPVPPSQKFLRNKLYTMLDEENLKIYVTTHFSDSISNAHIEEIRRTIVP